MRLAPVRCRVLLHSLLPTDDACSSSSLSTTVIKFSYFRTPLANFLLSRPNSVEYSNSKTTTLLPSAKCTRPLFQGRTGCGGRPAGWHDIVTCQRLVFLYPAVLPSLYLHAVEHIRPTASVLRANVKSARPTTGFFSGVRSY